MTNNERQFQMAMSQVKQSQLLAEYYKLRIETGQYVDRVVRRGGLDGALLSKEELLADETATMLRHIHLAQSNLDFAYTFIKE